MESTRILPGAREQPVSIPDFAPASRLPDFVPAPRLVEWRALSTTFQLAPVMQNKTDDEHLRLLSIFHYVLAGVTALGALFPVIPLVIRLSLVMGNMEASNGPAPASIGGIFIVVAVVLILIGMSFAAVLFMAGKALKERKSRTFCLVVAAVSCLFMPFGTVLGVFTIIVLMRESVQEEFQQARVDGSRYS